MKPYVLCLVVFTALLAACTKTVPCPVCYEDEWSREPFPGQPKQHTGTLSPEDAQKMERPVSTTLQ